MNKKGLVFGITMVLVTLAVLTFAYIVITEHMEELSPYVIGEQQISLIEGYQEAEDILFQMDTAVNLASKLAVYQLAKRGGFSESRLLGDPDNFYGTSGCGNYKGFPLWNTDQKTIDECFPDYTYEYQEVFNLYLGTSLPSGITQVKYSISLEPKTDYTVMMGLTGDKFLVSKGIRTDSNIYISPESLKDANEVTSYEKCTALSAFMGQTSNGEDCFTTKDTFDNEFVSLNSPYIRFIENAEGNAFMPTFAEKVVATAEAWHSTEGGSSSLAAYSGSTGTSRSCGSKHNLGQAIDITGCYDNKGVYHDSKVHDDVFNRCEELVRKFWAGKGLFISYKNCINKDGSTCASKDSLTDSHNNHMHIDER